MHIAGGKMLIDADLIMDKIGIEDGMRVADLGCGGHGYFTFAAADRVGRFGRVYGVDILRSSLESLERRIKLTDYKNIETIWSDLEIFGATKIDADSLDVAMLVNTLHLASKKGEVMREAYRMIKNKGKLVVIEWKDLALPFGPDVHTRIKKENVKAVSSKLGLNLEEEFFAGPYHYGLIFTKI